MREKGPWRGAPPRGCPRRPRTISVDAVTASATQMKVRIGIGSVGLRPEDLRTAPTGAMLGMDIDFVEELGATQLFHGKLAGTDFVVQAPTGQIAADTKRLALSIDPVNVHLFDPQTTQRLGR